MRQRAFPALLIVLTAVVFVLGCDDEDDGAFPGLSDIGLLVATRGPDALELFDAQTFQDALDSPTALADVPLEARAAPDTALFVVSLDPGASGVALAFDSRLFEEVPGSAMAAGGRVAFDPDQRRIYLAERELAFFDARDFSRIGFPPIDLDGEASDVVYDAATRRVFVAVSTAAGARLRVFDAVALAEVPPSPIELPGPAGSRTADLLLVAERGELFVALPGISQLAAIDVRSLQPLPRTPIDLRVQGAELARDIERERIYAASAGGSLESVRATAFSLSGGFPRTVAASVADLAFDPETQQLFAADSVANEIVVLDAATVAEEADSPIEVGGAPVSVEIIDLESEPSLPFSRDPFPSR